MFLFFNGIILSPLFSFFNRLTNNFEKIWNICYNKFIEPQSSRFYLGGAVYGTTAEIRYKRSCKG